MEIKRVTLRDWITLANLRERMVEEKSGIADKILAHLRISSNMTEMEEGHPWFEIRDAFFQSLEINKIRNQYPILKQKPKRKEEYGWDYDGRDWYYWVNLFASSYGWTIEHIECLDIDDAIALLQEIELDNQFDREWEHSLSELAYRYDKSSKKSKYVPLKRPGWMNKMPDEKKLIRKIPKSMIPPGIIKKVTYEEQTPDDT